jgi:bacterioferritin-associated ferredoxin
MYICVCNAVTDHAIRDAVAEGARTVEDLTMRTGCAGTCADCRDSAQALLDELLRRKSRTRPDSGTKEAADARRRQGHRTPELGRSTTS